MIQKLSILITVKFLILHCSLGVLAQSGIYLIKGEVSDASNSPLSYASIRVQGSSIGTVTNSSGHFRLVVPASSKCNIIISSVGFKSKTIQLKESDKDIIVKLDPKIYNLTEVNITPKKPTELLLEAIANIPENYPDTTHYWECFYRESIKEDKEFVALNEAICLMSYESYTKPFDYDAGLGRYFSDMGFRPDLEFYVTLGSYYLGNLPKEEARILQLRKSMNFHKSYLIPEIPGGPVQLSGAGGNVVKYLNVKNNFLFPENFNIYEYNTVSIVETEQGQAYKISFKPRRKKSNLSGIIFINTKDFAFEQIEYFVDDEHQSMFNTVFWKDLFYSPLMYSKKNWRCHTKSRRTGVHVRTNYFKHKGVWYLKSVDQEDNYKYVLSKHYIYENNQIDYSTYRSLVVNKILDDTLLSDSVFKPPFSIRNGINQTLAQSETNYNDSCWSSHNIKSPTKLHDKIRKDLEKKISLKDQYHYQRSYDSNLKAPLAYRRDTTIVQYGNEVIDPYAWMSNKSYSNDFHQYLEEENDFTQNYMEQTKELQRRIYLEIHTAFSQSPKSNAPKLIANNNGHFYWLSSDSITNSIQLRYAKNSVFENTVEVKSVNSFINKNKDLGYYSFEPSPDNNKIALGTYKLGGDFKTYVLDIEEAVILDTIYGESMCYWIDNNQIVYDSINQIKLHTINSPFSADSMLFEVPDSNFTAELTQTENGEIMLGISNQQGVYENLLHVQKIKENIILQQINGIEEAGKFSYSSYEDDIYIFTSTNKLIRTNLHSTESVNIFDLAETRSFVNKQILKNYIVLTERLTMENKLMYYNRKNKSWKSYTAPEGKFLSLERTQNVNDDRLLIKLSSWTEPDERISLDLNSGETTIISKDKIPGYDPSKYESRLVFVKSQDGEEIPVTLIFKKKMRRKLKSNNPLYIYAYGGHEIGQMPDFEYHRLSLIERGVIYAIAHVRGGNEKGKQWYKKGRQSTKKNTFSDFNTVCTYLIKEGYTTPSQLVAEGGSAGGLLMAVAANQAPQLYNSIVLRVPFVDVLSHLKKSNLSYTDYGNPHEKSDYENITEYNPYSNISHQEYPNMFIYGGFLDHKIAISDIAKYAAKIRKNKKPKNITLLIVNHKAGHALNTYEQILMYYSSIYSFCLSNLGIDK
jgi:oligopeptidase B